MHIAIRNEAFADDEGTTREKHFGFSLSLDRLEARRRELMQDVRHIVAAGQAMIAAGKVPSLASNFAADVQDLDRLVATALTLGMSPAATRAAEPPRLWPITAEAGEIKAQHADAFHGQGLRDARGGEAILPACKAMGEDGRAAPGGFGQVETAGQTVSSLPQELEICSMHPMPPEICGKTVGFHVSAGAVPTSARRG